MSNHKVLVIDDSMVIRRTVKGMLPDDKFEVVEAKDGAQGLELIHTCNPNLIMLDFFLPKKSGYEVFQEIQKDPRLKAIPLLLMSGRKDEVTDKIPEPFEFFSFLEKPFDQKQLIQGIRESMEKSKKLAHLQPVSSATAQTTMDSGVDSDQLQKLQAQVKHLESEVAQMKKQINQLVSFIKKKLQ
ncbi:response regulator [Cyanobacterium aponinum UTEX 3222]|uniref:Response regulator receiver protein n=3 Tax=Cyanobacterium aponinum TaxID=379064 RepID=K9Z1D5_CYAAP|nr:response regulator [Cyanobacterium aponinum]MTF37455.1 response regulator [Cyanobacterium aponinum 0216]WRL40472.1 response regulator [Cyanobacterium aponinum UTEX 3222]AFZ52542.1 response regulator receiver protein [Cyanobacterium aponinum PCC 10605]PHV62344.1 response regulator [Cyanobacterium aponinum IPPAS B-1201]WPF87294.1 response regulator [Cyanobacterium aponinum AL20115]